MNDLNKKAKSGIKALMGRQLFVQILTFAGGICLARILTPSIFGLYAIVTSLIAACSMLGDFGLSSSLIQKKAELSDHDLQVGFTLQQILISAVFLAIMLVAPEVTHFYRKAPPETVWLVRAVALTIYLTSWRSMSALQMERHLNYGKLAIIEVVETVTFQGLAVVLAFMHFGVWSFVWATLARGILGTSLAYISSPWPVRFRFDKKIAREILSFGIPFQMTALINNASTWVTPFLVGRLVGPQAVGYLSWASSNGKKPLTLVDSVMRVSFPHFSRIQHDLPEVLRIMSQYLTYLLLATCFWSVEILTAGDSLVTWVYTNKWHPALIALELYAVSVVFECIAWLVGQTQNALGQVKMAVKRASIRTACNLGLSIPLTLMIGYNGVPLAGVIALMVSMPFTFNGLPKGTMKTVLKPLAWIFVPTLLAIAVGDALRLVPVPLGVRALMIAIVTAAVYFAVCVAAAPPWLKRQVLSKIKRRNADIPASPLETAIADKIVGSGVPDSPLADDVEAERQLEMIEQ